MAYTDQQEYAKYLASEVNSEDEGCGCGSNESSTGTKCSCCPPGLVEARDKDGNVTGCVTPNDAELLFKNTMRCPDGYIKTVTAEGDFLGCLTPDEYAAYIATLS